MRKVRQLRHTSQTKQLTQLRVLLTAICVLRRYQKRRSLGSPGTLMLGYNDCDVSELNRQQLNTRGKMYLTRHKMPTSVFR